MTALRLPFGMGRIEFSIGRPQWARIKAILNEMPTDDRAERECMERLFRLPGEELILPAGYRSLAANDRELFCVAPDSSLFVRSGPSGGWRYLGICPGGWYLTVTDTRLYCLNSPTVYSRPIDPPDARWELFCETPRMSSGESDNLNGLGVSGGHLVAVLRSDESTWTRPLHDRKAGWTQQVSSRRIVHAVGCRDRIFAHGEGRSLVALTADPGTSWQYVGRLPDTIPYLATAPGQLLAHNPNGGPIYARSIDAGPEAGWRVIGRVRSSE
jgi:hypothetical protein